MTEKAPTMTAAGRWDMVHCFISHFNNMNTEHNDIRTSSQDHTSSQDTRLGQSRNANYYPSSY